MPHGRAMKTSDESLERLGRIADAVAASYEHGRPIDSLETTALPNRRQIVAALREIEHVVYMGFYSTRTLSHVSLRQHIGEHLHRAAEILVEQTARAVGYHRNRGLGPSQSDAAWSEQVVMEMLGELPHLRGQLALDVQAAFDGDPAAKSIEEVI